MHKLLIAVVALLLATTATNAQANRSFSIKPPCDLQHGGTEQHIVMSCQNVDGLFAVEMVLLPTPSSLEEIFAAACDDISAELGVHPRLVQGITRNGKIGQEVITDIPGQDLTERDQLWVSPFVLFKIKFKGKTGSETGKAATEFLESYSSSR